MKKYVLWSFSVSFAGFLFGFDTIVISGTDKDLQDLWQTSDLFHGFVVMASALWGTVLGALAGSIPVDKIGRKKTLILIGVLFLISAVGSALANDPYWFAAYRFIGGIGVGLSTIAAPAYISEIVPASSRGQLVAMYQLSIVIGILFALMSNYILQDIGKNAWRWMLGIEALPAVIYCAFMFLVPKSPRWLVLKGKYTEAAGTLKIVNPSINFESFKHNILSNVNSKNESIFSRKYRYAFMLLFFIAFFNQFSGINAILYYAPRIFEEAGLARSSAFLSSVGIGVVNVIFTVLGMSLIDKLGRKSLMYIGSVGYILSLSLVSLSFYEGFTGNTVPFLLFLFIASHAIGQGTVIWVFIAELFPTHLRASGQAFGSTIHWVLAALIPSIIPLLFGTVGASVVFLIFAIMMMGQLLWVYYKMPETKGVELEQVSLDLNNK